MLKTTDIELLSSSAAVHRQWLAENPSPQLTPAAAYKLSLWHAENPTATEYEIALTAWRCQREDLGRQQKILADARPDIVNWAHRSGGRYIGDVAKWMDISRTTASDDVTRYAERLLIERFVEALHGWTLDEDYTVQLRPYGKYSLALGLGIETGPTPSAGVLNAASALLNRLHDLNLWHAAEDTDGPPADLLRHVASGGSLLVGSFGPPITGPRTPQWAKDVAG